MFNFDIMCLLRDGAIKFPLKIIGTRTQSVAHDIAFSEDVIYLGAKNSKFVTTNAQSSFYKIQLYVISVI